MQAKTVVSSIIFFLFFLCYLLSSLVFAESGPMTNKPKGDAPSTKVDQMRELLPDLIVSEIFEDSAGNIVVKIKNIGKTGLKDSDYDPGSKKAFIELIIDGKSTKNMLTNVDPQRVLMHPNIEILWNTGQKVWDNPADVKTELIVKIDPFNQIQEANKNNNSLRKLFSRPIPVKSDLIVKSIYRCGPNISFCIEIENKGNKEFRGSFSFDVDIVESGVIVGSLAKGQIIPLHDRNGIVIAQIYSIGPPFVCKNIVIPANTNFSPAGSPCEFGRIFSITPAIPEEGFDIQVRFLIEEEGKPQKRGKFNFHITT